MVAGNEQTDAKFAGWQLPSANTPIEWTLGDQCMLQQVPIFISSQI